MPSTRGLDPNVPLKPSGIPWLDDIPKHWGIVRNMALFAHRVEPGIAELPVLQVSLRSGITAEELDQFGRPQRLIADATKYKRIHQGDVAYIVTGKLDVREAVAGLPDLPTDSAAEPLSDEALNDAEIEDAEA